MLKEVKDLTTPGVIKGLNTQLNMLALQKDQSPNMMDVKVNYDGSVEKRLGSNTQNALVIANSPVIGFSPDSASKLIGNIYSFWNMDEPSGIRGDVLGHSNLNLVGDPKSIGGIKNSAVILYSSSSQYLYANHTNQLSGNSNFSMSGWFYLASTSLTSQQTVVAKIGTPATGGIDAYAILMLHADGTDESTTFTDSSLSNHTVSANSGAQIDTAQKKFGTASGLFDGVAADLTIADSADWDWPGDYTVEAWVRWNDLTGSQTVISRIFNDGTAFALRSDGTTFYVMHNVNETIVSETISNCGFQINTWYHLAVTRSGSNVRFFVDGIQKGSTGTSSTDLTFNTQIVIGARIYTSGAEGNFKGWIDEIRVSKGIARWTSNFTPSTSAYSNTPQSDYEYKVFVDTDNQLMFTVSSSGTATNGSVKATSIGALDTSTWYNWVVYYSATNFLGISVNLSLTTAAYTNGIRVGSGNFYVGSESDQNCFNGRMDDIGRWTRMISSQEISDLYNVGSGNTYQPSYNNYPWAAFDFGASALRWLTASVGTGVYASSDLGINWVTIATDRSATYQYLDRSKNVLIMTSESYDKPLYWAGSAGTYAQIIGTSTPLAKYSINFQGYLILLNSLGNKRRFHYLDENVQLSSTAWLNFDIPSSADDEITNAFILRRYMYVSTRYKIYRISYVGGNPDWQYVEVKNWGFIPRTCKKIVITNNQPGVGFYYSIGEVVVGLTYDRKLRIFDGSGDQIVSNSVEKDNKLCDFALEKISYVGSGPIASFAEVEPNQNVYKLVLAIGSESQQTTHMLNYDGRSMSLYPYANMKFNCMCMAESANQRYLMAFDRSGYCHLMDSGNLDGNTTLINDYLDSPFMFDKTPSQSSKGHQTDMFFSSTKAGRILYQDRIDFSNSFSNRKSFVVNGTDGKLIHYEKVDIPETYNSYQFKLTSSSSTSDPWRLQRYDHFLQGLGIGKNY